MERNIYVTKGYITPESGFGTKKKPIDIPRDVFEPAAKRLEGYLLKIYYSDSYSYDDSDDDRSGCFSTSSSSVVYGDLDPYYDSEAMIWMDNEIKGVVFRVTESREEYRYAFFFDGSIHQTMTLGYSASHSSNYIYVNRVELVKKGENGAPQSGKSISFHPSKSATSL